MGQNVHINKQIEMQIEIYGETLVDNFWRVKRVDLSAVYNVRVRSNETV